MDPASFHTVMLILLLPVFLGLWAWAWSRKRKPTFDEASRLPLEEDEGVVPEADKTEAES